MAVQQVEAFQHCQQGRAASLVKAGSGDKGVDIRRLPERFEYFQLQGQCMAGEL